MVEYDEEVGRGRWGEGVEEGVDVDGEEGKGGCWGEGRWGEKKNWTQMEGGCGIYTLSADEKMAERFENKVYYQKVDWWLKISIYLIIFDRYIDGGITQ